MLLTISKSELVSAGRFSANCHMQEVLANIVDCWKDVDPSTHAHTWTSYFKDIMIIEWASTVLPQLWWRRSWSWQVWAWQHKEVHITWRRYYSKMTLRYSYGWWSRSYFQWSSITLKVSSKVYHSMHKDLYYEESKGYELQRCRQRLECYDSILILWGDLP